MNDNIIVRVTQWLNKKQSMPGRNWCKSGNLHMHNCLHEWLLLITWNCKCDSRFMYLKYRASSWWSMWIVSFGIKQDKTGSWKQKVTVTSVAVVTVKFLRGMCNCTVVSDVGTGDTLLVFGILLMCGHAHVWFHMSLGMDWKKTNSKTAILTFHHFAQQVDWCCLIMAVQYGP